MTVIRTIFLAAVIAGAAACKSPNNAASTRESTLPMSTDPSTTLPGTGANRPFTPAADQDSAHVLSPDSSQVIRVDTIPKR